MSYSKIVEQFKNQIDKSGVYSKEDIDNTFCKAEEVKLEYLKDLYKTFSYWSKVYFAEEGELDELKMYKVPEAVIDFYKDYEPNILPCLDGYVTLLSLDAIKEENSELAPSAYLLKYGLLTFATTVGGNAVCMDLNSLENGEPRVIYVDSSWVSFNEDMRRVEYLFDIETMPENDDDGWFSVDIVKKYLPEIAKSFSEFMYKLSNSEYEDIEAFYDAI